MNRYLLPINIILTVAIIALLALITANITTFKMGKLFPKAAPTSIPTVVQPQQATSLASFAPILEKGLFGKAIQGPLTPITAATTPTQTKAAPPVSQGDLVLLGTAMGSARETFALILKSSTKEERVFRLGDNVFDAGTLISVQRYVVEVLNGKTRVKIFTPDALAQSQPATTSTSPGTAPPATGGIVAQGAGNFVIDQRALNAALSNIGQAMTAARLLPSTKDGKVEGFKASEVKPDGIFGLVGIKDGDVIVSMNDFTIDSPEKAMQALSALKGQNHIKLDLIRDGNPTTFNYEIR
ncbi:MAG: PDZ domain-containing protein [Desulfuromonadales bacterium]|nr:PDZ domain-containing protein [Desulfuromonadales bacterium]